MNSDADHPQPEAPEGGAAAPSVPDITGPEPSSVQLDEAPADVVEPAAPAASAADEPVSESPPPRVPQAETPKLTTPLRVEPPLPSRSHDVSLALLNALERLLKFTAASLMRPKVRLVVIGAILIILGVWAIDHSVWTFPLVIIGIVMILVAWVGSRLEGRFGIEWNEGGAGFEMQARFKSRAELLPGPSASTSHTGPRTTVRTTHYSAGGADETVIEGEAHTIEIDVEELKALVEAAERSGSVSSATANGSHVSWQGSSTGVDRGVNGPGG
jgi:hypothetical protein